MKSGLVIGVAGVSRSGKSYLARELAKAFEAAGQSVKVLAQDDFVFPESEIPMIRDHIDWECPESINFQQYIEAIKSASTSHAVTIAEGLLVFWDAKLFNLCDCRIFIALDKAEFIKRKKPDLRWGPEPDWYIGYIWDSYLKFGQIPTGQQVDWVLDGTQDFHLPELMEGLTTAARVKGFDPEPQ